MEYTVPVVENLPGTVIAINVGGAVIPTIMSVYLLITRRLMGDRRDRDRHCRLRAALARQPGARHRHRRAGISSGPGHRHGRLLLSRGNAAPLAYIAGSMGTLIGADLTNLDKVRGLGAPVASIGGAGTFDGIFLTGILAVLLAGLYRPRHRGSLAQPLVTGQKADERRSRQLMPSVCEGYSPEATKDRVMPWYDYVAHFFAGAFLANGVPHFVQGICGNKFQTPFASPRGVGKSSAIVNVIWGWF